MTISLSRRSLLEASATAFCAAAIPYGAAEGFSAPDLGDDVAVLRQAYETLHPGLLRYNSAHEMAARFDALSSAATSAMSLPAFYLLLSRFLATVRCGHTYANFYNQPRATRTALFEAPDRLPFAFLWLGSKMVVTADPHGIGILRGSEVLAIDGQPVGDLLARLMLLARADGHNDAKRRRLMSMQGEDRYESFDIFFSLLAGRARYSLLIEEPGGRRITRVVDGVSLAERRAKAMKVESAPDSGPAWRMERRQGVAILTMPNWALYDSKWDWRQWLDTEIDRLVADRVPALVIDLRGNEGGLDCGNSLVERLIARPTPMSASRRLVRYRKVPDALLRQLDTWDHRSDDWGKAAKPFDARFFELTGPDEGVTILQPRSNRYEGRVRVLTDPQNSSATHQFAQLVQQEKLAELIGEPTGGNRRGINGGYFYTLTLPHSRVEVDVPLIGLFPVRREPDAGVLPDIVVAPTRDDVAKGRDRVLARALL